MRKAIAVAALALFGLSLSSIAAHAEEKCVPVEAAVTPWTTDSVAPDGFKLIDTRTITDSEAYDEVISEAVPAQHYSYKGGPIEGVPLTPAEDPDAWQANTTLEPHYQGGGTPASNVDGSDYVDGQSGLHYTSHQSEGLADWFYFQAAVDAVIEHHDAVTHDEYKYGRDAVKCPPDDNPKPPPGDDKNPPKDETPQRHLAMTGSEAELYGGIAAGLAALGSVALYLTRRKAIA